MIARMLVVDDDDLTRRAVATAMTRAGFAVEQANDIVPAMALSEAFDIVLVDYNMTTGTGDDVVRHYKKRFGAKVYCVVLSGEQDDGIRDMCLAAGADAVFVKPASLPELRRSLIAAAQNLLTQT